MTGLVQQLEALRVKMLDEHAEAVRLLETLDRRMVESDAEVMRKIEAMLAGDLARKADIVRALQTLAARIGHMPGPAMGLAAPPEPRAAAPELSAPGRVPGDWRRATQAIDANSAGGVR